MCAIIFFLTTVAYRFVYYWLGKKTFLLEILCYFPRCFVLQHRQRRKYIRSQCTTNKQLAQYFQCSKHVIDNAILEYEPVIVQCDHVLTQTKHFEKTARSVSHYCHACIHFTSTKWDHCTLSPCIPNSPNPISLITKNANRQLQWRAPRKIETAG